MQNQYETADALHSISHARIENWSILIQRKADKKLDTFYDKLLTRSFFMRIDKMTK